MDMDDKTLFMTVAVIISIIAAIVTALISSISIVKFRKKRVY